MRRKMSGGIAANEMGDASNASFGNGSAPGISPARSAFRQEQRDLRQSGASPEQLMANRNDFRASQGRQPIGGTAAPAIAQETGMSMGRPQMGKAVSSGFAAKPGIEPAQMGAPMGGPAAKMAAPAGAEPAPMGKPMGMTAQRTFKKGGIVKAGGMKPKGIKALPKTGGMKGLGKKSAMKGVGGGKVRGAGKALRGAKFSRSC